MKIIFEHDGRKTTIIGNDYQTIVEKIRSLFPNESYRRIQFYDPELTDYFEFTSYDQVLDQPNGLKMKFDLSITLPSADDVHDPSPASVKSESDVRTTTPKAKNSAKSSRRSLPINPQVNREIFVAYSVHPPFSQGENEEYDPPTLPTYCDLIVQGLQSRSK